MRRLTIFALMGIFGLVSCAAPTAPTEDPTATATGVTEVPTLAPTEQATKSPTTPAAEEPTATPGPTPASEATPTPRVAFEPVVGLEPVAEGLGAPVDLMPPGDGSGRLFIVDQIGVIRILTAEGQLLDEPFLDVRDRMVGLRSGYDERGLLGLAFHPDFAENGLFYVYYSAPLSPEAPQGWNHTSYLSRFGVSETDENAADSGSEQVILRVHQPQSNHDGGKIAFGPDRMLYVALGDGGGGNDVGTGHVEDWYEANRGGNGQDVTDNLLGSVLRIDVDGGDPYAVPEDNPFVGRQGLDEIWAYGFRNPYRFSFDAEGDHELLVADAGQNLWEEVSLVTKGGNYGWNVKEGSHCFSPATPNEPPEACPETDPEGRPLIDPIIEYQNANAADGLGLAVVGGHVYRGDALPGFEGRYVFGDWSRSFSQGDGTLFVATRPEAQGSMWQFEELQIATSDDGRLGAFLLALGQDARYELYALTSQTPGPTPEGGRIYRIVKAE